MIGFLLLLFVVLLVVPGLLSGLLRVGAAVLIAFGVWVLLHPECQTDACRRAMFNLENDVRTP